jgi:hypothetical protein
VGFPYLLVVLSHHCRTPFCAIASQKKKGTNQKAELLKAQGNELHQKAQYQAAYRKYTAAINEDGENAVYYANRAASSLALKQ